MPILQLDSVTKRYGRAGRTSRGAVALDRVTLGFAEGTFTAIMGPSGSGKSSLLHCAAGLDRPTSGTVELDGQHLETMSERRLTLLRRRRIGFVFQSYNLIPTLTVAQNVELPLWMGGKRVRRAELDATLAKVGLGDRRRFRPDQLSGGQRQRVAIARALITRPAVIFADEPTGALDLTSAAEVLDLLRAAVDRDGRTLVVVTHDPTVAARADRVVFLADGRLRDELLRPTADEVATRMTAFVGRAQATRLQTA